jgi:hypothetical protein
LPVAGVDAAFRAQRRTRRDRIRELPGAATPGLQAPLEMAEAVDAPVPLAAVVEHRAEIVTEPLAHRFPAAIRACTSLASATPSAAQAVERACVRSTAPSHADRCARNPGEVVQRARIAAARTASAASGSAAPCGNASP